MGGECKTMLMKTNKTAEGAFNNAVFLPEEEIAADLKRRLNEEFIPRRYFPNKYAGVCKHGCKKPVEAKAGLLKPFPGLGKGGKTTFAVYCRPCARERGMC